VSCLSLSRCSAPPHADEAVILIRHTDTPPMNLDLLSKKRSGGQFLKYLSCVHDQFNPFYIKGGHSRMGGRSKHCSKISRCSRFEVDRDASVQAGRERINHTLDHRPADQEPRCRCRAVVLLVSWEKHFERISQRRVCVCVYHWKKPTDIVTVFSASGVVL
jgi:hypothetical protein